MPAMGNERGRGRWGWREEPWEGSEEGEEDGGESGLGGEKRPWEEVVGEKREGEERVGKGKDEKMDKGANEAGTDIARNSSNVYDEESTYDDDNDNDNGSNEKENEKEKNLRIKAKLN